MGDAQRPNVQEIGKRRKDEKTRIGVNINGEARVTSGLRRLLESRVK